MSVTGINNDSSLMSLYDPYGGTSSANNVTSTDSTLTIELQSVSLDTTDSSDISKPSEFFNMLQQLKNTDPEKFKQVCTDIANKLKTAAQEMGDSAGAKKLSELADKFQNVANGGDISQLMPPGASGNATGTQAALQQYAQQGQISLVDMMNSQSGQQNQSGSINDIMSSIFEEVDQAVSS